jgi:hypothetical protein
MTFRALVEHFARVEELPIRVSDVLDWIRANTDHKDFTLHAVERQHRAFRGAFRRMAVPNGKLYSHEVDIITQVLYGQDLDDDWKRLVIVKEALHVFEPPGSQTNTPEGVRKLIAQVISPDLRSTFMAALDDHLGAYRAMAVLLPRKARTKLKAAVASGTRTTSEVARYVRLPDFYVGLWLDYGHEVEPQLLNR